jgi:hypothetical protein
MIYRHAAAACIFIVCSPCYGKDTKVISWSKKDITYEVYKKDAAECAKVGYYRDVSKDEPAKKFLRGFRTADEAINQADMGGASVDKWRNSILITQPDKRMREVQNIQVDAVENCLFQKGYKQFVLNKSQTHDLKKYKHGSEERRNYLYSLSIKQ